MSRYESGDLLRRRLLMLVDSLLGWVSFALVGLATIVAPWFFGSWEMWWFWPFTTCVFLSFFFFSARLCVRTALLGSQSQRGKTRGRDRRSPFWVAAALSGLPFLLYALIRFVQAPVFMTAERSFLLLLTPCLIAGQIAVGFSRRQRRILFWLIVADLCLLGLYGLANHYATGSTLVMWAPGYAQYYNENRMSGSYFCPDHFAGIMELSLCLALGQLLTRGIPRPQKLLAVFLGILAMAGIVFSKSRGGGLTVIVMLAAALFLGFWQWRPALRWAWRASLTGLAVLTLVIFARYNSAYMNRFTSYFGWETARGQTWENMKAQITPRLLRSARGRMIGGALRTWQSAPILGVGPGMHQNLWTHFAATPDGDRELGIWPTMSNADFHSYEVHSDWVQLMEEYGVVGLTLFLVALVGLTVALLLGLNSAAREPCGRDDPGAGPNRHATILGGALALVAMCFHSLGDFNLQMPATTWLLAAILAISLVNAAPLRRDLPPKRP